MLNYMQVVLLAYQIACECWNNCGKEQELNTGNECIWEDLNESQNPEAPNPTEFPLDWKPVFPDFLISWALQTVLASTRQTWPHESGKAG